MTNFEKHRNEIKRIVASKESPAKVNGELRPCRVTICNDCEFNKGDVGCNSSFIQWAVEDEEIDKSCRLCKYGDRGEDEHPCIECTERYSNQFEPKPKEPELKPCPFCGGKAGLTWISGGRWLAGCEATIRDCAITPATYAYSTKEEAIEEWNRRADK